VEEQEAWEKKKEEKVKVGLSRLIRRQPCSLLTVKDEEEVPDPQRVTRGMVSGSQLEKR
jgi:hypothetical protein